MDQPNEPNKNETNENISYVLENGNENENEYFDESANNFNINDFMTEFDEIQLNDDASDVNANDLELIDMYACVTDYDENYTLKQLMLICEYYDLLKEVRAAKASKKLDVIGAIVMFENNPENGALVYRRKQLWHYINELKSDKFMKKFVFW